MHLVRWIRPALETGIGDRGAGRAEPRDRGDIDDPPAALPLHDRSHGLGQKHGAGEVDVDDLRPLLVGEAIEVGEGDRLIVGGVVDQDVEPAEAFDYIVDQALHLVALGHVAGEGRGGDLVLFEIARDAAAWSLLWA